MTVDTTVLTTNVTNISKFPASYYIQLLIDRPMMSQTLSKIGKEYLHYELSAGPWGFRYLSPRYRTYKMETYRFPYIAAITVRYGISRYRTADIIQISHSRSLIASSAVMPAGERIVDFGQVELRVSEEEETYRWSRA
jgi:hypothetical protein